MTTALPQAARSLFDSEHKQFRDTVRTFIAREIISNLERWEEQHLVDRSAWVAAGKQGLIGIAVPEEYGG
ncbi:MAG: hypothetical protein QOE54_2689, partial [Streptosporangiaceae bacterium]|nr:hypothetical protein [Streptosporangiaceae bacterium]